MAVPPPPLLPFYLHTACLTPLGPMISKRRTSIAWEFAQSRCKQASMSWSRLQPAACVEQHDTS